MQLSDYKKKQNTISKKEELGKLWEQYIKYKIKKESSVSYFALGFMGLFFSVLLYTNTRDILSLTPTLGIGGLCIMNYYYNKTKMNNAKKQFELAQCDKEIIK